MADFLIYSGYSILLINLILYAYSFFRKEKANVFFVSYLAFAFLMQISMETLFHLKMNNLFLVNTFFIGQMIFLGLFYYSILKIKIQKQFVKVSLIVALLVLTIQFVNDPQEFLKFNLFEITLTSLLIVVFALLHFYNMLTENKTYYYASMGIIIYLLSSTVLFIIGNLTSTLNNDVKYLSWMFNAFLNIVYYLFIMYEWKVSFSRKKVLQG
ncbi:hypothetical protein ASE40_14325 [Flavobacterium sp. Root935]|jgi:hypothetical protein|uniref:hypothetical protein n=3 Tax=unclassified Flavobacterium TaxID=196869 RepID=UPI00070BEB98|nr:hypothetical protein [Flavobacterium sp. Root935]KRD59343.1 hypothetical protein ASE40_14325 [Flavobacterium sp. Root935]BDU23290.1 hypothetical protein FLGSB24_00340 [Flavobacterium sp. GSB-24]